MKILCLSAVVVVSGCANLSTPKAQWAEYKDLDFETIVAEIYRSESSNEKYFEENLLPINSQLYAMIKARKEVGLPVDDLVESRKKYFKSLMEDKYRYFSYVYLSEYDKNKSGFSLKSTQMTLKNHDVLYLQQCFKNQGCHTYIPNDFGVVRADVDLNVDNFYLPMKKEYAGNFLFSARYSNSTSGEPKNIKIPAMYVVSFQRCVISASANKVAKCQVKIEDVFLYDKNSLNIYDQPIGVLTHLRGV
ncbi:hypothetical protein [Marinobacterium arenosum]|uniref:hypothetical protein n=1 Tax=Marinobacterium arenosum TaxID=2862496 RepID=UPI001C94C833|nr:hypothetical protein [Marinobacterium arenosum]MBY4677637.1 hypothetical protein [Marinobacterium arenosum]